MLVYESLSTNLMAIKCQDGNQTFVMLLARKEIALA